jgi:peptide/nickel transport system substrate-binding protein/oligopeptide transport system substrate-binding protein
MDPLESIYSSFPGYANLSEGLVRVDKDWNVMPAHATDWAVSDDGMSWTFTLQPGLKWTNGDEVTADDYVASFQYAADPAHAWDFTWYYDGIIRNFGQAARGEAALSEIGVKVGADKYQVVFETERPTPFLPAMLIWSQPLHAASLAQYGSGVYNIDPATSVTNGPYKLAEFSPDRRVVMVANPDYTGSLKPMIDKLVFNITSGGSDFARYQAGEIDTTVNVGPGDLKTVLADPELSKEWFVNPGDFRNYYVFFDTKKPPFDDQRVRMAFAKAIDREAIVKGILDPMAIPAYTWLMPGFPDADQAALKDIQAFDPEAAKALLAEAGYPNGEGFPAQTLVIRGGGPETTPAVTQAVAASISQTLGVQIDLQTLDQPVFMEQLLSEDTIPLGWVTYGMDYLDATNMLSVWKGGGRHNWNNDEFDKLVEEGGAITSDPAARSQAMKDAERLLVESAAGAFVYHPLIGQLQKPYRMGSWKEANATGYTGSQWPGESPMTLVYDTLYNGADVVTQRKS